jgi:hypothetical protein
MRLTPQNILEFGSNALPQEAQPPEQKKSCWKVCGIIAAVVLGIFALGAGFCAVVVGKAVKETAENIKEQEKLEACRSSGNLDAVNYPDKQETDCVAGSDNTIELQQYRVTAGSWRRETDPVFKNKLICGDVTITNLADRTQPFNVYDFKVQDPSGTVLSFALQSSEGSLGAGVLVSGGTTSGKVCVDDTGKPGQYIIIWKPSFERSRGIWIVNL